MKKFKIIPLLFTVFFALFLFGPQVNKSYTINEIHIGNDLDKFIFESEAKYLDIRPNSEKKIVWFDSNKKEKTPLSIIYVHGYSASRMEIHPVCELIAKELKANVFYTRLTGHGRPIGDPIGEATVNYWINDAVEAVRIGERLGDKVVYIGTSTGGTLGAFVGANSISDKIAAYIFLSPNFYPKDPNSKILLYPWGKQIAELVIGKYRTWEPQNDEVRKYWTYSAPISAIVTMMGLVDVVDKLDYSKIVVPTLFIYSENDQVISIDEVKNKFSKIGSVNKKLISFNETEDAHGHVLAGNAFSPSSNEKVVKIILDFLNTVK